MLPDIRKQQVRWALIHMESGVKVINELDEMKLKGRMLRIKPVP